MEWYKKNNETWHWHLWQYETGPDKQFDAMLEEALGRPDADAIKESMKNCVRESYTSVLRFRSDLSYIPSE